VQFENLLQSRTCLHHIANNGGQVELITYIYYGYLEINNTKQKIKIYNNVGQFIYFDSVINLNPIPNKK
jgi:hypothetical protein